MSAGCRRIHARYFAITSSREPSRPITNGLPHLLGRPTYTRSGDGRLPTCLALRTLHMMLGPRIRERLGEPGDGEVGRGVAIGDRRNDARRKIALPPAGHNSPRSEQADAVLSGDMLRGL